MHEPGYTLITLRVLYQLSDTQSQGINVLHADGGGLPVTLANCSAVAATYYAAIAANIQAWLNSDTELVGVNCLLDDGVLQAENVHLASAVGTDTSSALPQHVCGVIGLLCAQQGRKRFGHICVPGVANDNVDDDSFVDTTSGGPLFAIASVMKAPFVIPGGITTQIGIYHRESDHIDPVTGTIIRAAIKSVRRRLPGFGS